mmetsp:Transcript_22278/g.3699  ORF Transcript_22278/g.3699 Transcript_22278/m.3699 type:complete len:111 (-) Transcript_22278:962-1294(-)
MIQQFPTLWHFIDHGLRDHNSDIFKFQLGPVHSVVLGNPKYCKPVSKLVDRNPYEMEHLKSVAGDKNMFVVNNPEFSRMKSYFYPLFSMKNIKSLHFGYMEKVVNEWAIP